MLAMASLTLSPPCALLYLMFSSTPFSTYDNKCSLFAISEVRLSKLQARFNTIKTQSLATAVSLQALVASAR